MAPNQDKFPSVPEEARGDGDSVFELSEELARIAKEELGEDEEVRESGLARLRALVRGHPHLSATCRTDRSFLLRFLRGQKWDVDKAFAVLQGYLRMRCENPHWFMNTDPADEKVAELLKNGFILVLRDRDASGRRVVLNRATAFDLERHNNSDIMKVLVATLETLLEDEENQIRGLTYIIYGKGMSLSHCSVWTPNEAATLFGTCEKSLSVRHRDINLIHLPLAMSAVVNFVKHLLSNKIRSRISSHGDDAKLWAKFPSGGASLPPEVGGSSPVGLDEMAADWRGALMANRKRLLERDHMKVPIGEDADRPAKALKKSSSFWSYIPGM